MGFGTNRVVGKQLNKTGLSATQMKGMNTLHGICGVKKIENKEEIQNTIIDKLSTFKKNEVHKSRLMADFSEESQKGKLQAKEIKKKPLEEKINQDTKTQVDEKKNVDEVGLKIKKPLSSLKKLSHE